MGFMGYVEELRSIVGHKPLILVGSVVIVLDDEGRILMQKRREPYGSWGLPGGLMELGESSEETAKREVKEETGLSIGSLNLLSVFSGKQNYIKISNGDEFYVVEVAFTTRDVNGKLIVNESEILDCKYIKRNELPENIVRSHRVILDKYFEEVDD
jgi:8-oxo-dGTP pyrophosphatase MutT (NUDIX family)